LVRAIARAHGGRIEVKSDAREGTTFRIILPRA
jgi:signal transduction histidine kinase